MNIYSSIPFIEAFGKAFFSGISLQPGDFLLQNQTWRLPTLPNGKPITTSGFIDFFEPVPSFHGQTTKRTVPQIARVSHDLVTTQEWFNRNLYLPYEASPLIDWTSFVSWDAFTNHVISKRSNIFSDTKRCKRKLEKDLGSVKFIWQDTRPEAFFSCIKWKSEQYLTCQDAFNKPENVLFFQELAKNGLLVVSSLSAGDKILAAHLGAFWQGRFYLWIPAYNAQYASYSPGRLMMQSIMEYSYYEGHKEFDFLIGGEDYKWNYATHTRLIAAIGGLNTSTKIWLKKQLSPLAGKIGREKLRQIKCNLSKILHIK